MAKQTSKKKAAVGVGAASAAAGAEGAFHYTKNARAYGVAMRTHQLQAIQAKTDSKFWSPGSVHIANDLGRAEQHEYLSGQASKLAKISRGKAVLAAGAGAAGVAGAAYYYRHVNGKQVKVKKNSRVSGRIPTNFTSRKGK